MKRIRLPLLITLVHAVLALTITAGLAQDSTCSTVAEDALQTSNTLCDELGRHQACYGHVLVNANAYPGQTPIQFERPGDTANVTVMRSLTLSPFNENTGAWGVAQMRVQANLPAGSENVTLLLFGSVAMENAVQMPTEATVNLTNRPFARAYVDPSTEAPTSFWVLNGTTFTARERLDDGSWLRIEDADGRVGWVQSEFVTTHDDLTVLNAVDSTQPFYRPMQAFYLKTTSGDASCTQLPPSGLLVQTPEGNAEVSLLINEVHINLGSTIYVANENQTMLVALLEGHAKVSTPFGEQTLIPGTQVTIPMSADSRSPNGPPSEPHPYESGLIQYMPTKYLPIQFESPAPLSAQIPVSPVEQPSASANQSTGGTSSGQSEVAGSTTTTGTTQQSVTGDGAIVGSCNNGNGVTVNGNSGSATNQGQNGINADSGDSNPCDFGITGTTVSTDNIGVNGTINPNASTDNNGINGTGNTNASTDNNGVNGSGDPPGNSGNSNGNN